MEEINTSVSKTNSLNPNTRNEESFPCSSEESGWTSYFEDFIRSNENKGGVAMICSLSLSSSLISDASSSRLISVNKNKRKSRGPLCNYEDDTLEDTACSSLNFPVNHMDLENDSVKQTNIIRDQDANGLSNGFGFGLDLVNSMNKIECTNVYYNSKPFSTLSSFVQGC